MARMSAVLVAAAWLILAVVFLGSSPTPGMAAARTAEGSGVIAFESDRAGAFNVYVGNADGGAIRRITSTGGYSPAWSPDGSRIAFLRGGIIYSTGADGTGERRVVSGVDQAWSPDGTRLAFMRDWDIFVVNPDGTAERRLTKGATSQDINTFAALPTWSPDGSQIVFERFDGLYLVSVQTGELKQLSTWGTDPDTNARPKWSPDGSAVAFIATCRRCAHGSADSVELSGNTVPALHVVRLDTGVDRQIANDVGYVFNWSPSGANIAFSRALNDKEDAPYEIFSTPSSGGAITRITKNVVGENSFAPAWSPDGQWLTYLRERFPARFYSDSYDIAVIRADGSGQRELTQAFPSGGTNYAPVWTMGGVGVEAGGAPSPSVPVHEQPMTRTGSVGEIAASGMSATVFSSESDLPMFWKASSVKLTPARPARIDCGDRYGLVSTSTHAAWFCAFAHGVFDPVTDVSLVITNLKTKRSVEVSSVSRSGHNPAPETGPRVAGGGSVLAFNPDRAGSKLYRIDTSGQKPRLRLIATRVAVEDVNRGRIIGWRGNATLVTVRSDGRLLATAPFARGKTTSVRLVGPQLFTTSGNQLSRSDLHGKLAKTWPLVDEGGPAPSLVGVNGDLAVYVSGVAVHALRLSTGTDVVLALPNQGPWIEVDLTAAGLFYAYNAPYTQRVGRVGFVSLRDLVAAVQ
jgi:Tol biopolymer transport system component